MNETKQETHLPDNAFTELKPGETYRPIIPDETGVPEVTGRSIVFGIAMIILFAAAASYIALKLGQGIETAIPISILAIGFSAMVARKSILIENVNILAIGCTSGILVGGTVFVMPAIFMLGLERETFFGTFFQVFLVPFLGAVLGVLFLIPFRRYFVADMHGKLPFPEATATTEILVTGEKGGKSAKVLIYSLGIGIVLDYLALAFRTWSDVFTTAAIPTMNYLTNQVKAVFQMNTSAAVLGLGMIIGIKYASIIMAGSMLAYLVLIPIAGSLSPVFAERSFSDIFFGYTNDLGVFIPGIRNIGIGGIFAAGVISILKMSPVIKQALGKVVAQIFKKHDEGREGSRLDKDIKMSTLLIIGIVTAVVIFIYFRFVAVAGADHATWVSIVSLILTLLVVFLFSAVSAWAIAMISVTPISGMTLTTLIIAAVVLVAMGLTGPSGMLAILLVGGVVCTALSMAGSLVTQFKIGYWLGSTPKTIQWSNIFGAALASLTVTAVIMLFADVYGFGNPIEERVHMQMNVTEITMQNETLCVVQNQSDDWIASENKISDFKRISVRALRHDVSTDSMILKEEIKLPKDIINSQLVMLSQGDTWTCSVLEAENLRAGDVIEIFTPRTKPLPAPQASAMAAVANAFLGGQGAPWLYYALGAVIALLVTMLGISALAFALGMYLPIELNSPILLGACVGWLIKHSSKDGKLNKIRGDKGILIASGFIAGGALAGVFDALSKMLGFDYVLSMDEGLRNWLGLIVFAALSVFLYKYATSAKAEEVPPMHE